MFSSFNQKSGAVIRSLLPVETAVVLMLLGAITWPIPYAGSVSPSLTLVAVYYWAVYRPDLFRPPVVFVIGLAHDVVNFFPLGLSACIFLALYQLSFSQRRFFVKQIFFVLWIGFAGVSLLGTVIYWIMLSIMSENAGSLSLVPVALQWLITVACFPLPAWMLIRLQRAFLTHR